jgi:antitoxin VapB
LPREYAFNGDSVYVKQIDGVVMLFPRDKPWEPFLQSLDRFSADFLSDGREQPRLEY